MGSTHKANGTTTKKGTMDPTYEASTPSTQQGATGPTYKTTEVPPTGRPISIHSTSTEERGEYEVSIQDW